MKILITGGKSALALKMLKAFETHQIVLADYGEMPSFSSTAYRFISLGEKNEDAIAHHLLSSCLDEEIDLILPLHAFEVEAMAKAMVLFSEFNITILLPPDADLSTYFKVNDQVKSTDWAVFKNGEALFMSTPNDKLAAFSNHDHLSGAFYINYSNVVANLSLITI